jgi:hypothetical protein
VTDQAALGFRPGSRKLLFVLGDAEPHGAGRDGLAGCSDDSGDPHGLDTAQVLAGLRTNEIALNLVLQASSAQTSLRCYQSLASAAYGNGTATQSGEPGGCGSECPPCGGPTPEPPAAKAARRPCPVSGAAPEDSLVPTFGRAIAREFPAISWAGPRRLAAGTTKRGRVSILNRAPKTAGLRSVIVTLPPGFHYAAGSTAGAPAIDGRRLTWTFDRALRRGGRMAFAFRLRAGSRSGTIRLAARFVMSDGGAFTARRRAALSVR